MAEDPYPGREEFKRLRGPKTAPYDVWSPVTGSKLYPPDAPSVPTDYELRALREAAIADEKKRVAGFGSAKKMKGR